MNILFFADNFPPERNAQASRVFERARYWVRWGHRVTVITGAPNFPEGQVYEGYRNRWWQAEQMDGIRVVRVKTFVAPNAGAVKRSLDFASFALSGWFFSLFEERPDVVAATSPQLFAGLAGWLASVCRRRPFLLELSDLWPASIEAVGALHNGPALWALEELELFLYRRAARIAAQTEAFRRDIIDRGEPRGLDPAKVGVVLNGVELAMYQPRPKDPELARRWGLDPARPAIGYLGTLGMAHGLGNVLEAAALAGAGADAIQWVLMGPGAEREAIEAEARRRGLANVTLIPAQPKGEMPRYWSLLDVALVHLKDAPVFATVIPSKIFEAMAMGLPVLLASPRGEASALLEDCQAGVWVPAGDPAALAEAGLRLAGDPALRAALADRALAAAPRFSRERQARDFLTLLRAAVTPAELFALELNPAEAGSSARKKETTTSR
jgi:glycosyltransferase involved in cell wall biosynthesis